MSLNQVGVGAAAFRAFFRAVAAWAGFAAILAFSFPVPASGQPQQPPPSALDALRRTLERIESADGYQCLFRFVQYDAKGRSKQYEIEYWKLKAGHILVRSHEGPFKNGLAIYNPDIWKNLIFVRQTIVLVAPVSTDSGIFQFMKDAAWEESLRRLMVLAESGASSFKGEETLGGKKAFLYDIKPGPNEWNLDRSFFWYLPGENLAVKYKNYQGGLLVSEKEWVRHILNPKLKSDAFQLKHYEEFKLK